MMMAYKFSSWVVLCTKVQVHFDMNVGGSCSDRTFEDSQENLDSDHAYDHAYWKKNFLWKAQKMQGKYYHEHEHGGGKSNTLHCNSFAEFVLHMSPFPSSKKNWLSCTIRGAFCLIPKTPAQFLWGLFLHLLFHFCISSRATRFTHIHSLFSPLMLHIYLA